LALLSCTIVECGGELQFGGAAITVTNHTGICLSQLLLGLQCNKPLLPRRSSATFLLQFGVFWTAPSNAETECRRSKKEERKHRNEKRNWRKMKVYSSAVVG